jgi:hypothetical protein
MNAKNPAAVALGRLGGQAGTGKAKAQLLDDARAEHRQNHANLHKQFTDEAVAWLKVREVKTEVTA